MAPSTVPYAPVRMEGITLNPDNPLVFDFLISTGTDVPDHGQAREPRLRDRERPHGRHGRARTFEPGDDPPVHRRRHGRPTPGGVRRLDLPQDALTRGFFS